MDRIASSSVLRSPSPRLLPPASRLPRSIITPMDFEKLTRMPAIKRLMTPFPHSIDIGSDVGEARRMVDRHGIRHLPVTEDGELVGVMSARDIALARSLVSGPDRGNDLRVRDACVMDVYAVGLAEPADNVVAEMARRRIGSALVVHNGKLAGIFTVTDACRNFAGLLRAKFDTRGNDAA